MDDGEALISVPHTPAFAFSMWPVVETGPPRVPKSAAAMVAGARRTIWQVGAAFASTARAATLANVDTDIEAAVEPDIARNVPISRGDLQGSQATPCTELSEWRKVCKKSFPDWVFIEVGCFQDTYTIEELALLVANAVSKQVSAVVLTTVRYADSLARTDSFWSLV